MSGTPLSVVLSNSMMTWAGGERWTLQAAAGLSGRGHEVTVVCRPGSVLREAIAKTDEAQDLRVLELDIGGGPNLGQSVGAARFFDSCGTRVVCCNLDREARTLGLASRISRGKPHVFQRRGNDYPLKSTPRHRLVYRFLVDSILVNSQFTRSVILERNGSWMSAERVFVVHNGVDGRLFHPEPGAGERARKALGCDEGSFLVGMVARVVPHKRHETLLRAAARLVSSLPSLRVALIGECTEPDYRASLEKLAAELGIEKRVVFSGVSEGEDMNRIYNGLDLFVLPSSSEGFSNSTLEAMSAGVPVAVSDASSLPELVGSSGEAGFVFRLDDDEALSAVMRRLHDDSDLRNAVSVRGRERVRERFALERMAERLERLFLQVVRSR